MLHSDAGFRVLVVAPVGRDSQLLRDMLASIGIEAQVIEDVHRLIALLGEDGVAALLITEEALNVQNIGALGEELSKQAAWSDLPIIILTVGGSATTRSRRREQERLPLGSPVLLERPIRSTTLISSIRSALRSRERQYQMRDTLLERDRADRARLDVENRLRTALEAANLGSWELDLSSGEIVASATFRQILDFRADEHLTYEAFLRRVHTEDQSYLRKRLKEAIESGEPYTAEYRIFRQDRSLRWMSSNGRVLSDKRIVPGHNGELREQPCRFAGVTLDITERVLSEAALRNADKLALVGRLASSIAHEINNPLEAVTNLLYLLASAELGAQEKAYVTMAQEELARVSEISAQTLTFNRQQNTYEKAVFPDVIESVLALYRGRLLTSGIHVERHYAYKQPVLCYPGEIRQVFTNLIGNAFDAMRKGGKIIVRERLASHPRTGQQGVRITFADSGTGMTEDVKAHLFEPFHSTKGNNGTGLGLWISSGIAKKHGGTLRCRSSTNPHHSGSVFTLFIPHIA